MSKRSERILLAIIFLIALGFRLKGLGWGLPYPYGHDGFTIISRLMGFFNGDFNPHLFGYPSFHMYFLFFVYRLIYGAGHLMGHFSSIEEFSSLFYTDPSLFIIAGRAVAALLGSGSVILCYVLAKRLFGRGAAFLAILLAILPMEVVNAHYCTTDIPLAFWFLLAFTFCARIMEKPNLRYYILSGIFTGIAGGTKYPGLGLTLTIITAHLIRLYSLEKRLGPVVFSKEHYKLVIALAVVGLVFFISTPYVFLDYKHSIPHIAGEYHIRFTADSFDLYQRSNENQTFLYIKDVFLNFGYLFTLLGLIGIGIKARKISREEFLLLSWIIPFAVIIHRSALKPHRYFLLISPFLLIFFANAITGLKEKLGKKFIRHRYVALFIALLIPVQPVYHSIKNDIILIRPDTREEAHDWIIENIPEGAVIAKELLWTPFLPKDRYKIVYGDYICGGGWSLGDNEMAWYKERNVDYFLTSKFIKDQMSHPDRPSSKHRQFYKDLEDGACLMHKVEARDKGLFMDFHNPTVLIYKAKF